MKTQQVRILGIFLLLIMITAGAYAFVEIFNPFNTTTTSTTTTTGTTTSGTSTLTTTTTIVLGALYIKAIDEAGVLMPQAYIYVDGVPKGQGEVRLSAPTFATGSHEITFGSVSGYTTPVSKTINYIGSAIEVVGTYVVNTQNLNPLTVTVSVKSIRTPDQLNPLQGEMVYIQIGNNVVASGQTDYIGRAFFNLKAGTYTAICTSIYGYGSRSATVVIPRDSNIQLTFTVTYPLSITGDLMTDIGIYALLVFAIGFAVTIFYRKKHRR